MITGYEQINKQTNTQTPEKKQINKHPNKQKASQIIYMQICILE